MKKLKVINYNGKKYIYNKSNIDVLDENMVNFIFYLNDKIVLTFTDLV